MSFPEPTDFRSELHQLVRKHMDEGTDPELVLDALEIQTEIVRTKSTGLIGSKQRPWSADDIEAFKEEFQRE